MPRRATLARAAEHLVSSARCSPAASAAEFAELPLPAAASTDPSANLTGVALDKDQYLRHRLTPTERAQFAAEGYIVM